MKNSSYSQPCTTKLCSKLAESLLIIATAVVTLNPATMQPVNSNADAGAIIERCPIDDLHHAPHGPLNKGNIVVPDDICVFEETATGVTEWKDGVLWYKSFVIDGEKSRLCTGSMDALTTSLYTTIWAVRKSRKANHPRRPDQIATDAPYPQLLQGSLPPASDSLVG